jgi:hypothetical protein
VEDLFGVLPAPTVEALAQLLAGTASLPKARRKALSADERIKGVSVAELVQALPRKTLEALLLRRMQDDSSNSATS